MRILFGRHYILGLFSLFSALLLILFLLGQYLQFSGLKLDVKWLIVSGIPILVGLFIGEYIKSFKGFGFEIEASLKAELPTNLILAITDNAVVDAFGIDKGNVSSLLNLDEADRKKISRLRFVFDQRGYYNTNAVREYFRQLRNLKYVEVVDSRGKFKFLIPIGHFNSNNEILSLNIQNFIAQIENRTLSSNFPGAITEYVNHDDSLLRAYRKLLSKTKKIQSISDKKLPVLDSNKQLIGLLSKIKVEEFISKEVLSSYDHEKSK